jgi:hypothetical protein
MTGETRATGANLESSTAPVCKAAAQVNLQFPLPWENAADRLTILLLGYSTIVECNLSLK